MKNLFFLSLLFVGSLLVAQPDCTLSDSLYYELDAQATQIILNEMVAAGTATDDPIEFDSLLRTAYVASLLAVHRLENSPERDTAVGLLQDGPFGVASTNTILLFADRDLDWMMNLRASNPSGNSTLDSMMVRYELEVTRYWDWSPSPSYDLVELSSTRHFNTLALAKAFKRAMPVLDFAEPEQYFGDGNRIEMMPILPSGWRVRYSIGSGDCPSGCIFRKNYDFEVEPVCTEFEILQSGGTAARAATIVQLSVYPTPFADDIHLPETIGRYSYELFDAVGRRVKASAAEQSGPISGLENLASGWYVLSIRDQSGKAYVAKGVKL